MESDIRSGCFLIANPTLRDPNFSRTVVLLCEHNDAGSMGLVINRPTEHTVAAAIPGMPDRATQPLFWGGPVQQKLVIVLHRSQLDAPGSKGIVDGMSLGADREVLVQLFEHAANPARQVRVFSGYAGWGAGQLEAEMRERSWIVAAASAQLVFGVAPDKIWTAALMTLGPRYEYLTRLPPDPRVN